MFERMKININNSLSKIMYSLTALKLLLFINKIFSPLHRIVLKIYPILHSHDNKTYLDRNASNPFSKKMKVAILKQYLDPNGAWNNNKSGKYKSLKSFYGKPTFWEFGTLFDADWYIIKDDRPSFYLNAYHSQPQKIKNIKKYTKSININEVPFEKYDVIVSLDPFFNANIYQNGKTIFGYILNEEADPRYAISQIKPIKGFDIFLDHASKSKFILNTIPGSISFPYPRNPDLIRKLFKTRKSYCCWIDRWVINKITNKLDTTVQSLKLLKNKLNKLGIHVTYKTDLFSNPGHELDSMNMAEDCIRYYKKISKCKYYFCPVHAGTGQSLIDAASLGCICIGSQYVNSHKLLCHPKCLAIDINDGINKLNLINKNKKLKAEILKYQDMSLQKWFVNYPKEIFNKAIVLKRVS